MLRTQTVLVTEPRDNKFYSSFLFFILLLQRFIWSFYRNVLRWCSQWGRLPVHARSRFHSRFVPNLRTSQFFVCSRRTCRTLKLQLFFHPRRKSRDHFCAVSKEKRRLSSEICCEITLGRISGNSGLIVWLFFSVTFSDVLFGSKGLRMAEC